MAGTPFRPHAGPGRDSVVLADLARLWDAAAAMPGARLSQASLGRAAGVAPSTVGDWATGKALPRDAARVDAVARELARLAGQVAPALQVWEQLVAADAAKRAGEASPGHPIAGLNPFALEVHKPVDAIGAGAAGLPALPPYARRAHDEALAAVVAAAASGHSRMAALVGGSSTGEDPGVLARGHRARRARGWLAAMAPI